MAVKKWNWLTGKPIEDPERKEPTWWETMLGGALESPATSPYIQQFLQTLRAPHEFISKPLAAMATAPSRGQYTFESAPSEYFPGGEQTKAYEAQTLPWGVKGALEELPLIPLYMAGGRAIARPAESLFTAGLKRAETAAAQAVRGQLPTRAERAAAQAARIVTGGKFPAQIPNEAEFVAQLYGTVGATVQTQLVGQVTKAGGVAAMQQAIKHIPQIAQKELATLGYTLDDMAKLSSNQAKEFVARKVVPGAEAIAEAPAKPITHLSKLLQKDLTALRYTTDDMLKLTAKKARELARTKTAPATTPKEVAATALTEIPEITKLAALIKEAKPILVATQAARHRELQRRVAILGKKYEEATTISQAARARGALKGEMPIGDFTAPAELGFKRKEAEVIRGIISKARLSILDKQNLEAAMFGSTGKGGLIFSGVMPTRRDIILMERALGVNLAKEVLRKRPTGEKVREFGFELFNLPRSILASFDLSAPGRQGITLLPWHPKSVGRAFKDQLRALASQENTIKMNEVLMGRTDDVATNKWALEHLRAGIFIDDLASIGSGLSGREEAFMARFLQRFAADYGKLSLPKKILGAPAYPLAKGVQLSERAYVTYLNKLRADVFHGVVDGWRHSGKPVDDHILSDLAKFINRATGRGELGLKEYAVGRGMSPTAASPLLSAIFFSPRLQTSRLLLPFSMFSGSSAVKKLAARDLITFFASGIGILSLLNLHPDVNVETNPRSSDFGKVRIGNTRIDFWGGFQPWVRFTAQEWAGQRKTKSGAIIPIDRWENLLFYGRLKLAPVWGYIANFLSGYTPTGEKVWQPGDPAEKLLDAEHIIENFAPMFIQDVKDAMGQEGLVEGAALASSGFVGGTVSSYDSAAPIVSEIIEAYSKYSLLKKEYLNITRTKGAAAAREYANKHPEIVTLAIRARVGKTLLGLYEAREEILKDERLSDEQKNKRAEELSKRMIKIAQAAILKSEGLMP